MSNEFPLCPHLPTPDPAMDWRVFSVHGKNRGPDFYVSALRYGNYLWSRGLAARAILCLDRALGSEIEDEDPMLRTWPLPYSAMAWIMAKTPSGTFIGNPRVHFQHYADRMNHPRQDQRRWRAWACWAVARMVRPDWPADPRHEVIEPDHARISEELRRWGHRGEDRVWAQSLDYASSLAQARR